MIHAHFRFLPVLAILLAAAPAWAQGAAPNLDQYPSFVQLTAMKDGTQSVLRCGYTATSQTVSPDPGFREISVLNQDHGSYSRIQRIDDALIATAKNPTGGPGMLLELVKADGTVVAKNCRNDAGSDTIEDCRAIHPFTFADQIKAGDTKIATQCDALLRQNTAQINPSLADPEKTEAFKAALRQKAALLAAP